MLVRNVFVLSISIFVSSLAFAKTGMSGKFMIVKGDVKVQRTKNELINAKVSLTVYPGDTVITGKDSRAKIAMDDRNVIHVSPDTQFKFETYLNDGTNKNVELNLKEGKIRNNVENTYDGTKNKFIIKTPTAVAGVRGTQFVTSFNKSTNVTEVVTLRGEVQFSNLASRGTVPQSTVSIKMGQSSSVGMDRAPEAPRNLPNDQMRVIDRETLGVGDRKEGDSTDAGTAPTGNNSQSDSPNAPAGDQASDSTPAARVDDRKDQSPDTFTSVKEGVTPTSPSSPTVGPTQGLVKEPNTRNLPGTAIRGKNEKTKVIIQPVAPPAGTSTRTK